MGTLTVPKSVRGTSGLNLVDALAMIHYLDKCIDASPPLTPVDETKCSSDLFILDNSRKQMEALLRQANEGKDVEGMSDIETLNLKLIAMRQRVVALEGKLEMIFKSYYGA